MNTVLKIIVVLLIIGAIGFYAVNQQRPVTIPTTTQMVPSESAPSTMTQPDNSSLQAGGSSYMDPSKTFSLLYPNDYILDTNDPAHIRIYKTGATQKGQTEMYDGVIMVFEPVSLNGKTLSEWVDEKIKTSKENGISEITEPKTAITVNNYPGFSYTARGLGESKYTIFQKDESSDSAVVITTLVVDPENKNYQGEVDSILMSIKILK